MPDDYSELQTQLEQAKQRFSTFHSNRTLWDAVINRKNPVKLQPELTGQQEGNNFESADGEKAVGDWIDVLTMNPTYIDAAPTDIGPVAKKTVRDISLWYARGWQEENPKRKWDRWNAEGQVRHGVCVTRLLWHEQKQSVRETRHPFYWQHCDIFGSQWVEKDGEIEVFYYEVEIPLIEAHRKYGKKKAGGLEVLGRLGWTGDGEAPDFPSTFAEKKVKVIVRDGRSLDGRMCEMDGCDHEQRTITTYICLPDGNAQDYEEVETIDSPFARCSFYVVGGRESFQSDPDLKYRPVLFPLITELPWVNYHTTLASTMARVDYGDESTYINAASNPEYFANQEAGKTIEIDLPEPGSGKMAVLPGEVVRYPKNISPHLMTMLTESEKRVAMAMPNRFLTGNAYTEASNATGTAFLQQAQQAALPANLLLANTDYAILESRRDEGHAICWWAHQSKNVVKYAAVMTGSPYVTVKGNYKHGDIIEVDAEMFKTPFDLSIRTKSETLAEEQARWSLAKDQYAADVIDDDQLMRAAGIEDPEEQSERLYVRRLRRTIEPLEIELERVRFIREWSIATGVDIGGFEQQLLGQGAEPQPGFRQGPTNAAGIPQQGSNPVQGPGSITDHMMQPAAINGVGGGSSPVG